MDYLSTRGQAPRQAFLDAMLSGLARDGGLYTPDVIPTLSPGAIAGLAGLPYAQAAATLMAPFVGGAWSDGDLREMTEDAYARLPPRRAGAAASNSKTICSCSNCFTARRWRSRISPCSSSAAR